MLIQLNGEGADIEVKNVEINIGNKSFRISVNQFNELVVNKNYDENDSAMSIKPSVSNEIRLS